MRCLVSSDGPRLVRFAAVGTANTAVHYAAYVVLWWVLPYLVAHGVAMLVATMCSYLLHCRFTFRVRPTLRKLLLFPVSNITNIVLSTVVVALLVDLVGADPRIASLLGGIASIPMTFVVSKAVLVGSRARSERGSDPGPAVLSPVLGEGRSY